MCAAWRMTEYLRTSSMEKLPMANDPVAAHSWGTKTCANEIWEPWKSTPSLMQTSLHLWSNNVSLPTGRFPCNLSSFGRCECYQKCCKMVLEFHSRNSSKFTGKNYSVNNRSPFILHPPRPFLPFYSRKLHENQDHCWNSLSNIQRSIVMDTLRYFRFIFLHNSPKTNLSER